MSKKIIFITSFYPYGQKENWLKDELSFISESDHCPIVIPRRFEPDAQKIDLVNPNIKVINIAMISLKIFFDTLMNFVTVFSLKNIILITHQSQGLFDWLKRFVVLPKTYAVLKQVRKLNAVHIHCYSTTTVATMGAILSRELAIPFSFTLHTSAQLTERWRSSYRSIVMASAFVRTISQKTKDDLQFFFSDLQLRIHKVYLGLRIDAHSKKKIAIKARSSYPKIIMVCVLEEYKGVDNAIYAVKRLIEKQEHVELDIYGDGSCADKLKALVDKKELTQFVTFKGHVPNEEIMNQLNNMDRGILLLTSDSTGGLQEEGIPVAAMEAMRAGVMVVATQNGGISELIDDNQNGFLIPQKDINAICDALTYVIKLDSEAFDEIICKAKLKIVENFNAATNAKSLLRLLLHED